MRISRNATTRLRQWIRKQKIWVNSKNVTAFFGSKWMCPENQHKRNGANFILWRGISFHGFMFAAQKQKYVRCLNSQMHYINHLAKQSKIKEKRNKSLRLDPTERHRNLEFVFIRLHFHAKKRTKFSTKNKTIRFRWQNKVQHTSHLTEIVILVC